MIGKLIVGAACVLVMAATADAAEAGQPIGFAGASLGMSMDDWKALTPPPGVGSDAAPVCTPFASAGSSSAGARPASWSNGETESCDYGARFGRDVLPHSIQLDPRYRATGLRYLFVAGRMHEIDFNASVDAYDDVVAMLEKNFGAPTLTVRDKVRTSIGFFPRVRQTWRTSGGNVSLIDPGADPVQLSVRFTAPQTALAAAPAT
jgi:hypothetical protein